MSSGNGHVPKPRSESVEQWGVHVTEQGIDGRVKTGPIEALWSEEDLALADACARSGDEEVLAAAVTRYVVDHRGERKRIALYVNGARQKRPYVTDHNHTHVLG